MYGVSAAFKSAVLKSHTVVAKAELWTPPSTKVADLKFSKADVTIDRTAKVRRTCSIQLADESKVPYDVTSPMWPSGNEIKLYRGIRIPGSGRVTITVTDDAAINAVLGGLFLDGVTQPLSPTQNGNWLGAVGSQGYILFGRNAGASDVYSLPPGVTYAVDIGTRYDWTPAGTADVRALTSADGATRNASIVYSPAGSIQLHLDFATSFVGTLSLYMVDWDGNHRRQTITVAHGSRTDVIKVDSDFINPGRWIQVPINADYTDELVPLGVFRIAKPNIDDDGVVDMKVNGYDRSKTVSLARFSQPYVVAAGTRYDTAIKALIQSRVPWFTNAHFNLAPITNTTPQLVFPAQKDPWDAVMEMADAVACDIYFDNNGVCVMTPQPDPMSQPTVASFNEGSLNTALKIGRAIDDDNVYNGFIVNGESTANGTPIYSEKWDDDPASSTYRLGPYGQVPEFYTSNMITTQAQADAYALAMYYRRRGFGESVEFDAVCNPALDAGDIVQVKRSRAGVSLNGIIESIKLGLGVGDDMHVALRRRNIAP